MPQPQTYDFIVNPDKPPKTPLLTGGSSLAVRVAVVSGGLLVLLIAFIVLKGIIAGSPKLDSMLTVAQDQQELIHLTTNTGQQQNLSTANQNLAATAQLSLNSAQDQLVNYMTKNGFKVKPKVLTQKVSTSIDTQLTNAATAGTYDQTFQDTIKSQLNTYTDDLKQAYGQISGKNGRALLSSDYNQAQLLLSQTNVPLGSNTN